jgi:hypothetical protein
VHEQEWRSLHDAHTVVGNEYAMEQYMGHCTELYMQDLPVLSAGFLDSPLPCVPVYATPCTIAWSIMIRIIWSHYTPWLYILTKFTSIFIDCFEFNPHK